MQGSYNFPKPRANSLELEISISGKPPIHTFQLEVVSGSRSLCYDAIASGAFALLAEWAATTLFGLNFTMALLKETQLAQLEIKGTES